MDAGFREYEGMVDRVFGKVSELFKEAGFTDNEWRWARSKFPEFFKRVEELESTISFEMPKEQFWDEIQRWGKNHLHIFEQIKKTRASIEGIPEVSEDDVRRAIAEFDARPAPEPKPAGAAKRKRSSKRGNKDGGKSGS